MWGFVVLIGIIILLYVLGIYALVGVFAALSLHARGLRVLDHSTAGAPLLFRALITPGMIALWPVLVLKWRKAARGLEAAGAPDSPVRAMGLRRIHGLAVRGLAVALPVVIAVAVVVRQPIATSEAVAPLQEPVPLPHVATERKNAFDDLPIALRIRTDNLGSWQLELDVARDLEKAALGLYWSDVGDNALSLGHAVYLGNVYGPGARRFVLDAARLSAGGSLLLYSFVEADVVARADVTPITARASGG